MHCEHSGANEGERSTCVDRFGITLFCVKEFTVRFPYVGIASAVLTALGGYGLYWYTNLSKSEQDEADRLAADYAKRLFNKGLDELTAHQASRIHELVKAHFAA